MAARHTAILPFLLFVTPAFADKNPLLDKVELRFAKYDGARVHYESVSNGTLRVVFVHSWTCDLSSGEPSQEDSKRLSGACSLTRQATSRATSPRRNIRWTCSPCAVVRGGYQRRGGGEGRAGRTQHGDFGRPRILPAFPQEDAGAGHRGLGVSAPSSRGSRRSWRRSSRG